MRGVGEIIFIISFKYGEKGLKLIGIDVTFV
jgi:hypothetical protein